MFKPLPWEYGIRNLFRRPLRSALTLAGLTTVIVLVFVVVGVIRGLERSLAVSGDPQVLLVYSLGMGENLEYSSIPAKTADLVSANVDNVQQRFGKKYASPELFLGTQVGVSSQEARKSRESSDESQEPEDAMGLVRGITQSVLLVRAQVEIVEGDWPGPGEVIVGRLAATKLGTDNQHLGIGNSLTFEGKTWRISGTFSACGSVFESELWCRLDDLQQAMKRQDLSLVAIKLTPSGDFSDVDLFCKERLDLELQAIREADYYAMLQKDYGPVRTLAWFTVLLISAAGVFAGLNTMYGAVLGRVRELATLQTIGFVRRAIVLSLIQEGTILGVAASLLASLIAFAVVHGTAVRFTMGAFELSVDSASVLFACATGFLLGLIGSIPPAIRVLQLPVVDGLKAV